VNIKTVLKTSVAAAALVAVAAPATAAVNNGNKNSLTMSGQIARSLVYQDNGQESELFNTDGVDTATRLRWIASGEMTESITVGGIVEMNMPSSNSGYTLADDNNVADSTSDSAAWGMRKTEVTFSHKAAGKLSIGQGSAAGDGASTQSLGSWGPSMSVQGVGGNGSSKFNNSSTTSLTTINVGSATGQYDPGRIDRVRYDTPSFGGFSLAASYGSQSQSGVGASYSGKFGGIQVAAGAFYQVQDGAAGALENTAGGSVAVKHDSGISAHVGYTRESNTTNTVEGKEWHAGIGYAAALTNLGTTGFAVNYTSSDDANAEGDSATVIGVAVNQNISAVGTDLFLAYSRTEYDTTGATNFDDFSAIMAGTRLNF
jgi:hypothetical protein